MKPILHLIFCLRYKNCCSLNFPQKFNFSISITVSLITNSTLGQHLLVIIANWKWLNCKQFWWSKRFAFVSKLPISLGDNLKWTVKSTVCWWQTTHLIWAAYSAPLIKSMRSHCFHSRYHVDRMYSVDKLTASINGIVEPSNTAEATKDMLNVHSVEKKLTRYLCSHSQTTSAMVASRLRQLCLCYHSQLQTLWRSALLSRTPYSIGVAQ